jgi:hypothetical protein
LFVINLDETTLSVELATLPVTVNNLLDTLDDRINLYSQLGCILDALFSRLPVDIDASSATGYLCEIDAAPQQQQNQSSTPDQKCMRKYKYAAYCQKHIQLKCGSKQSPKISKIPI